MIAVFSVTEKFLSPILIPIPVAFTQASFLLQVLKKNCCLSEHLLYSCFSSGVSTRGISISENFLMCWTSTPIGASVQIATHTKLLEWEILK